MLAAQPCVHMLVCSFACVFVCLFAPDTFLFANIDVCVLFEPKPGLHHNITASISITQYNNSCFLL